MTRKKPPAPCPRPEKAKHLAEGLAWKEREDRERKGVDVTDIYPYKCVCRAWHIGHHSNASPAMRAELLQKKIDFALHGGQHRPKKKGRRR